MTKRVFDDILDYKQILETNNATPIIERIRAQVCAAEDKIIAHWQVCSKIFKSTKMDDFDRKLVTFEDEKHFAILPDPEQVRQQWEDLRAAAAQLPDDKEIVLAHRQQMDDLRTRLWQHYQAQAVQDFRKAEQECLRLVANRQECAALKAGMANDSLEGWERPI